MNYGNNDIVIAILSSYYNRKFEIPHHFRTLKTADLDPRSIQSATFPLATDLKDNTKLMAQATGQGASINTIKKDTFEFRAGYIRI
jgi:hypothetical protein